MTQETKDRVRFWTWLGIGIVTVGIALGRAQLGVEQNTEDIDRACRHNEKQDDQIIELRIQTSKIEDMHEDIRDLKKALIP